MVEFEISQKTSRVAIIQSEDDIPLDVDYYMLPNDVHRLEQGMKKAGKEVVDETLFNFALDKGVIHRVKKG